MKWNVHLNRCKGNVHLNKCKPLTYLIANKLPDVLSTPTADNGRHFSTTWSPRSVLGNYRLLSEIRELSLLSSIVSKRKQRAEGVRHCNNLGIGLWKRILTAHGINTYLSRASTPQSTFIGILCATKGYTVLYLGTSSVLTTLLNWLAANGVHIRGYYPFRIPQGHPHDFVGNDKLSITLSECIRQYWTSEVCFSPAERKVGCTAARV